MQALHYSAQENRLRPVADDPVPRLVSDVLVIDRTSVAGADRLGSLFLLRLPWEAALAIDGGGGGEGDDGTGAGAAGAGVGAANPMSACYNCALVCVNRRRSIESNRSISL